MAGWIPIRGWGGPLILRELHQADDGRIYSKWMREVTPAVERTQTLSAKIASPATFSAAERSFLLSFKARATAAKTGKVGLVFLPENGATGSCEFSIDLPAGRAQFAPGALNAFAPKQKSLREGGAPHHAGDFAIENLNTPPRTFTVRLLIKNNHKLGGSLIDAEIAGQRTMITFRSELSVSKLLLRPDQLEIEDLELSPCRF